MPINIDQLQPGPELDCLIAEEVMEWSLDLGVWIDCEGNHSGLTVIGWRPSVGWGAVGLVVERIIAQSTIEITSQKGNYRVRIIPDGKPYNATQGYGETAPLAICRAVLVGVGGLTNEKT